MCTALSLMTNSHYFGRTLDLECRFKEAVVITPRRFPLSFRHAPSQENHFAMIGMASVIDGYPLYYDAANEVGLAAAALNFPGYAAYLPVCEGKTNLAPFEFMLFALGRCACVAQVKALLKDVNLCCESFSCELPNSPLHFLFSDATASLVVEPLADGLRFYDNPAGVMTNSPPFDYHMNRLRDFMALSPDTPKNAFSPALDLTPYSRGMGAIGLPGDWSSVSRFIRAAYLRAHSACAEGEDASVSQFFRILDAVSHVRGCVRVNGQYEITQYACCASTARGVYYYTTYENSRITAVDMHREDLDATQLIAYPLIESPQILLLNART